MYSLPQFGEETLQELQINKLFPNCVHTDAEISDLNRQLYEIARRLAGTYTDKTKFLAGQTKKDLKYVNKHLNKIKDIMQKNPMLLRYMELKSNAIEDTGLDVSVAGINTFNSFFGSIKTMCRICEFHCNKFGNTGGRYKNNALSNESTIMNFMYDMMHIYQKATGKNASGNYPQGGIIKDTPFIAFVNAVLEITNNELKTLNNGYGIHFSVYDIMRKIQKITKK